MSSPAKLQDIFDLEIARLHAMAQSAALDIADLKRLETLVSSYSKFKKQDLKEDDLEEQLPTQALLDLLK